MPRHTLAPYLFGIIIDYALTMTIGVKQEEQGFKKKYSRIQGFKDRRRSRWYEPVILTDIDFADDIATISEEMDHAQDMLRSIELEGTKAGLKLNVKNTEMMLSNQDVQNVKSKDGNKIVDNFKYLGE